MDRLAGIALLAESVAGLADPVETTHRVTWQGALSPEQAVALGIGLAALCGLALFAESRLTGRRAVLLFWPARVIVVALVVWMLLEPTHTTTARRTERKTLAVIADVSGSMDIIDPPDAATDIRWSDAAQPGEGSLLAHCDRLLPAVGEAHTRVREAIELAGRPQGAAGYRRQLDAALRAARHAEELSQQIDADARSLPVDALSQVRAIAATLGDDIVPGIENLADARAAAAPQARTAALQAVSAKLETVGRIARQLSATVVARATAADGAPATGQISAVRSRREKVDGLLRAAELSWLRSAEPDIRVQRWVFDDDVRPVAAGQWREQPTQAVSHGDRAAGDGAPLTNLTALLDQIGRSAASDRLEAVVLITDGRHNLPGARDPQDVAGSLGRLPVYVVPIGDDRLVRDVVVHHLEAPRAVAKDDTIVLEALVTAIDCAGERIQVELIAKDRFDNEEVVERHEFRPDAERLDEPVSFAVQRADVGRYEFLVRAAPMAEEASGANNQESVSVDVVETDIKVLLADTAPRWEFRYLSRLFERDEHIEYDQLLFQPAPAGTGNLADSLRLPTEIDEWGRYRVVLLGDLSPAQLPPAAQDSLRAYISERGGTVILIAGTHAMPAAFARQPLGELLPVVAAPPTTRGASFAVALTAEGRLSAAVQVADDPLESERAWQDAFRFTPVPWLSEYRRPKPTAHTLLRAVTVGAPAARDDEDAVLCWQSIGRGRVVYVSAPDTYRLRARHGDRYHHAFWGQLLRWSIAPELSAGSKTVRIRTDKQRYDASEPVQVTVELRTVDGEPPPPASVRAVARQYGQPVSQIDLAEDPLVPGQYLGRFEQLPDGALTIQPVGDDVARLLAGESFTQEITAPVVISRQLSAEMNDTRSNPALLARIAELTGGQVIPPTAVGGILQLPALAPEVIATEAHRPLWNNWWSLAVVSGCLIAEWIIRKRLQLL